jgi:DNA-binding XRE family transcriptional regulator
LRTRIKELREKLGLTQEELAKKVGVRRETVVFIEKGDYNCSIRLAHALARELGTTLDRLFIWEDTDG